jgi:hypothetical protein
LYIYELFENINFGRRLLSEFRTEGYTKKRLKYGANFKAGKFLRKKRRSGILGGEPAAFRRPKLRRFFRAAAEDGRVFSVF